MIVDWTPIVVTGEGNTSLNDTQFDAYDQYIRALADILYLRDWEITLSREETTSDCYAQVFVMNTENHALIKLDTAFWHGSRPDRREWLVHELVHCPLDRMDRVVDQLADQFPDNVAITFMKETHHRETEICVQRLARIIAPYLPQAPELPHDRP